MPLVRDDIRNSTDHMQSCSHDASSAEHGQQDCCLDVDQEAHPPKQPHGSGLL